MDVEHIQPIHGSGITGELVIGSLNFGIERPALWGVGAECNSSAAAMNRTQS